MNKMPSRAWVEINLDCIVNNLKEIKNHLGPDVKINGVIKADGYGHGAVMTAKVLSANGIDMLSVATLDEAIQLRKEKITTPILVLGYTDVDRIKEIVKNDIIVSVFDIDIARKLSDEARAKAKKINVHIKIDTGMNRIGFHFTDEEPLLETYSMEGLNICGTFTHFSTADESDTVYTEIQYSRFLKILDKIKRKGFNPGICHVNNSGGTLMHTDKAMNMVRTGLLLYGLYPSGDSKNAVNLNLETAMTFKAKIIKVKTIPAEMPVSYGNKYITAGDTKVATIACGYADGYSRILSGKAQMIISGKKVPVIGNICMDMCMADVSTVIGSVEAGDEAILFDGEITAGDIATLNGTINYEIVCRIGMRIPRVYLKNGEITKVSNYLLPV